MTSETTTIQAAREAGGRVGKAIARDVRADGLPREWTGLDPQDADQLTAAGVEPGTPGWAAAEKAAEDAYRRSLAPAVCCHCGGGNPDAPDFEAYTCVHCGETFTASPA